MLFSALLSVVTSLSLASAAAVAPVQRDETSSLPKRWFPIAPKVMIISMFSYEAVWPEALGLTENITLPGLSPLYPDVYCNPEGSICQYTTGEAEINAAASGSAVFLSSDFDLTSTYFVILGIAGVNPFQGTLGSVGLARYAVQVALAYEIDARQIPSNWTTGYWLQGSNAPGETTTDIYGTEVFELNTNLRDTVFAYLDGVQLNDSDVAVAYRAKYDYAPANQPPAIFYGDVATSDVYFAGNLLDEAFGNITKLWTNGTGVYALTAQEDNATLEALIRAAKAKLVDFSRIVLIRTASDFDRAPAGVDALTAFQAEQGGFGPAIQNILIAGTPIIEGIVRDWDTVFGPGIDPQEGWLGNSDDIHTLTQLKREIRESQGLEKRGMRMRR